MNRPTGSRTRLIAAAVAAMVAFAANSLLCRMALGPDAIDPASFTAIRFVTGALTLLLAGARPGPSPSRAGGWQAAAVLLVYALPFAFAYARLTTGTGALVLFGTVQLTMIAAALFTGERPSAFEWSGLTVAVSGLVWLVMPGLASSPPAGATLLMAIAGVAWGLYSLLGRSSATPIADVAVTFIRLAPATAIACVLLWPTLHASARGVALAAASGAVATGGGYVVWYYALRSLTATRAAILQLSVPALAALGGAAVLGETLTFRLLTAAGLILGGVGLAIAGQARMRTV